MTVGGLTGHYAMKVTIFALKTLNLEHRTLTILEIFLNVENLVEMKEKTFSGALKGGFTYTFLWCILTVSFRGGG